jgi:ubiquinone/menaquinone biosynthesis C-methylase UbiE/uncharacterized protein YbaR (Trm112 family)
MIENLRKIKKVFDSGGNIIEYLKNITNHQSMDDMVLISYDFQAGSYIKKYRENPSYEDERSDKYAEIFNSLGEFDSIMEVGVGEGTTFAGIVSKLNNQDVPSFGFDISYSRIQYAQEHLKSMGLDTPLLFTGNFFNCPIQDDAIDIVYSCHSLEPNGGMEKEILAELYRTTRKYLVLIEPIYEMGSPQSKVHMDKHGYVKNLHKTAIELGYKVTDYRILFGDNIQSNNNTGVIVIEKNSARQNIREKIDPMGCPVTKLPLSSHKQHYYCKDSLLLYPVINNIPCLLPDNAIVATHFLD